MTTPTTVDIGPGDAALVFRPDGLELLTPGLDEEGAYVTKHVQEACAVGLLLRSDDPRFVALRAQLEVVFRASCEEQSG